MQYSRDTNEKTENLFIRLTLGVYRLKDGHLTFLNQELIARRFRLGRQFLKPSLRNLLRKIIPDPRLMAQDQSL